MRFSIPSDHCPTVPFYWFALEDASYIFEGMSYLALLLFHLKNFRSPLKLEEVERAYSLIKSDCLDFQYEIEDNQQMDQEEEGSTVIFGLTQSSNEHQSYPQE